MAKYLTYNPIGIFLQYLGSDLFMNKLIRLQLISTHITNWQLSAKINMGLGINDWGDPCMMNI